MFFELFVFLVCQVYEMISRRKFMVDIQSEVKKVWLKTLRFLPVDFSTWRVQSCVEQPAGALPQSHSRKVCCATRESQAAKEATLGQLGERDLVSAEASAFFRGAGPRRQQANWMTRPGLRGFAKAVAYQSHRC